MTPYRQPLPSDTIFEETNDSTQSEWDPRNDDVILAQPTVEKLVTPLLPSTKDPPHDAEIPSTQDDQNPLKDDENPPVQNHIV